MPWTLLRGALPENVFNGDLGYACEVPRGLIANSETSACRTQLASASYMHGEARPMVFVVGARHARRVFAVAFMKVLIVDDNRDAADSLAALVRVVLDCDVCVRYSGEAAIATAGDYRPDVVILDVNMPGLDGLQTGRILKTDRRLKRKTFIAHTADDGVFVRKVASRLGFHQVVAKGDANGVSELIDLLSEVEPA